MPFEFFLFDDFRAYALRSAEKATPAMVLNRIQWEIAMRELTRTTKFCCRTVDCLFAFVPPAAIAADSDDKPNIVSDSDG